MLVPMIGLLWKIKAPFALAIVALATGACNTTSENARPRLLAVSGGFFFVDESSCEEGCLTDLDSLLVIDGAGKEGDEPLVFEEIGSRFRTAYVEYSSDDDFGETRVLCVRRGEDCKSVNVLVAFDTDYGFFLGSILPALSEVRRHGDVLCLNLAIERLDGPVSTERWRSKLSFPE